jgi:hypothetical protein
LTIDWSYCVAGNQSFASVSISPIYDIFAALPGVNEAGVKDPPQFCRGFLANALFWKRSEMRWDLTPFEIKMEAWLSLFWLSS